MQKGKASIELILKGLSVFKTGMKGVSMSMKQVEGRARAAQSKLVTAGKAMANLRNLMIGGAGVMAVRSFVRAANIQEAVVARLTAGLKNVRTARESDLEMLLEQAAGYEMLTTFADEQVISAQAMLSTFQLNGEQIAQIIPRLLDMAAATEKSTGRTVDLEQIAIALGKAFTGQVGLLSRYGVVMDIQKVKAMGFSGMLQALDDNFKGIAKSVGATNVGKMKRFGNVIGTFKEQVGKVIVEGLIPLIELLQKALLLFIELPRPIRETTISIGILTTALIVLRKVLLALGLKAGPAGWVVLGIGAIVAAFIALRASIKASREEAEKITKITEADVKIAKSVMALSDEYIKLADAGYDALGGRWIDEAKEKQAELLMASMKLWEKEGWSIERARQTLILFSDEAKKTAKIIKEVTKPTVPVAFESPEEAKLQRMILLKDKYPALWAEMNASIYALEEDFLTANQAILDQLDAAKKEQFVREYEYWRETLQEMVAGYDTFWATILEKDMTGKARREAIWESMKRAFVARIAAMLKAEILAALTRESLEKKVTTSMMAEHAKQVLSSLSAAAADMIKAVAAGFKWLVSKLGPFGLAAGIALGAGLIAAFSGFKRMLGFAKGGKVTEEMLAVLHPPEIVAPEKTFLDYSKSLLAEAGRRGMGGEESLGLLRQINEGIQEMREKDYTITVEGALDGQTFYRKTIVPAKELEARRKL